MANVNLNLWLINFCKLCSDQQFPCVSIALLPGEFRDMHWAGDLYAVHTLIAAVCLTTVFFGALEQSSHTDLGCVFVV